MLSESQKCEVRETRQCTCHLPIVRTIIRSPETQRRAVFGSQFHWVQSMLTGSNLAMARGRAWRRTATHPGQPGSRKRREKQRMRTYPSRSGPLVTHLQQDPAPNSTFCPRTHPWVNHWWEQCPHSPIASQTHDILGGLHHRKGKGDSEGSVFHRNSWLQTMHAGDMTLGVKCNVIIMSI